jgi:hypothetical protein
MKLTNWALSYFAMMNPPLKKVNVKGTHSYQGGTVIDYGSKMEYF